MGSVPTPRGAIDALQRTTQVVLPHPDPTSAAIARLPGYHQHRMIGHILPIARNSFIESLRQPILVVMLMIAAFLQVMNTWIIGFTMGRASLPGEVTGDNKLLYDISMSTVFVLGIVLASFVATAAISREIENKTILTVVSKPISRPSVILGKYIGIAMAMLVAIGIMVAMLLMSIRHGVQTTAADEPDFPVILFGLAAVFGSIIIAGLANFVYGWSFSQTASLLMLPLIWIAYFGVLLFNDEWEVQAIATDFPPQIFMSCIALGLALLVISAVATAVSTRVGQVMTIMICGIVFLMGLMSNHFIGRHVYSNDRVAEIAATRSPLGLDAYDFQRERVWELAAARNGMTADEFFDQGYDPRNFVSIREVLAMGPVEDPQWQEVMLRAPGSMMIIDLLGPPTTQLKAGDSFYYGSSPNGVGLVTPPFAVFDEDAPLESNTREEPGLMIVEIDPNSLGQSMLVMQIGEEAVPLSRPPLPKDSVFLKPTKTNAFPLVAWSVIPNMQSYWLIDAINKNQPIPMSHMLLVVVYSISQIIVFLALAVVLFQGRDVG
jgi:ABC-2 family transporter protein